MLKKNFLYENATIVIVIVIVTICIFICMSAKRSSIMVEHIENTCVDTSPAQDMGQTARDACNKIEEKASEIKETMGGLANIIDSALPFLNPKNYGSGSNTTDNIVTNIIKNNLSSCEITNIENSCTNNVTATQFNNIDNTKCKYCESHECSVSGVRQINKATVDQKCTIQASVNSLLKKTNSVDAQALAKVLQQANGLLSGDNSVRNENCSVIDNNMSSNSYTNIISNCANNLEVDQQNSITFCGKITDTIQENAFDAAQSCIVGAGATSTNTADSSTTVKNELDVSQKSTGLDMGMMMIIAIIVVAVLVLGGGVYYLTSR